MLPYYSDITLIKVKNRHLVLQKWRSVLVAIVPCRCSTDHCSAELNGWPSVQQSEWEMVFLWIHLIQTWVQKAYEKLKYGNKSLWNVRWQWNQRDHIAKFASSASYKYGIRSKMSFNLKVATLIVLTSAYIV